VRAMLDKQVEGLVVAPASVTSFDHLASALDRGVPVVLLDRDLPKLDCDSVVIDNEHAAFTAVSHLLSLGHRRIGLLAQVNATERPEIRSADGGGHWVAVGADRPATERVLGYLRALATHAVPVSRDVITWITGDHPDEAAVAARGLLSSPSRPTAVFATDNESTRRIFLAAKDEGITVPGQLSLLGFDDLDWTVMVEPQLSVVAQRPREMGRMAGERLFARIKGDAQPKRRIVLPTELLIRASTGGWEQ
jgi:LacI family transcriptional regulator